MPDSNGTFIKTELLKHLNGQMAFLSVPEMLKEIPFDKLGERPHELPYSSFELFYHIYYTQKDIMKFMMNDSYQNPDWPNDYWPKEQAPKNEKSWGELKKIYFKDCHDLKTFLTEEKQELSNPVKHATKKEQSLLREVLLILNHSAYHAGQMLIVLRLLGLHK